MDYDKKYYVAVAKCLNCGHEWDISIPQGTLVSEWFKGEANNKCQNCKCDDARVVGRATA